MFRLIKRFDEVTWPSLGDLYGDASSVRPSSE